MTTITIDKELALRVLGALEAMTWHFGFKRLGNSTHADSTARGNAHKAITDLRAAIEAQQQRPIAYLAWRDGRPCYEGDDAVCEDPVWPVDSDDDRESMPVYLAPQPAQPQEPAPQPTKEQK